MKEGRSEGQTPDVTTKKGHNGVKSFLKEHSCFNYFWRTHMLWKWEIKSQDLIKSINAPSERISPQCGAVGWAMDMYLRKLMYLHSCGQTSTFAISCLKV